MSFDIQHLDRLRADADMHNVDTNRVRLSTTSDGLYTIHFPAPVVPLGPWGENVPDRVVTARSAENCEIRMLDGLIKLSVAERRAARVGHVIGWSGDQINRKPLTEEEIAAYKARTNPANRIQKLQAELTEALARQAARAAAAKGAEDLAQRYGLATAAPVQHTGTAISGKPAKRQRKEVNSHE